MDEMDLEDTAREKEKQKQKRAEGGASPNPKRARLAELYRAQIPGDTEMESQGTKYEDDEDEYVEDEDEYVDDGDDDDEEEEEEEEEEQQEMDFTEPEKPPEMPQEHKDYIRKANESLIQKFGTADSVEIDIILRQRAWKEEEERIKVMKEETEEEKKEKIKIEEILNHVDSLTVFHNDGTFRSGTVGFQASNVGNLKFFLLAPWTDMECTKDDMTVRSLDMYYKRLMPNTESAYRRFSPSLWNSLPEVDAQYVLLYNKLDTLYQQKSWASFSREMTLKDLCKAEDEANALNLRNLGEFDISECLNDVFMERDTIAAYKLRTEYDLYLLECLLHKKRPQDFIINDPSEISHNPARFCPRIQQGNFFRWMEDQDNFLEKTEEECKRLIVERQEKNLAEYCGSRIRYVKFKRALAKDLKIISEET